MTASAHVGYEFNQGIVNGAQMCGGNPNLPLRKGGDMLVVYDFEGGSDPPAIKLSRWLKTGESYPGQSVGAICEVNNSSPTTGCWGDTKVLTALTPPFAEGLVNTFGAVTDNIKPPGAANPGTVEFGEAGIDLTGAGVFTANTCAAFGNAYAVTRSSGNSSQAAMMDIVGPAAFTLTNCATVAVSKTGNDGGSQAGAVFTLYPGSDTTAPPSGPARCRPTAAARRRSRTCNRGRTRWTRPRSRPATPDPNLPFTFTVAAGENKALEFVDQAAPGTVNVTKVDDDGDPVAGATFTLYSPAGTSGGVPTGSAVDSCLTGLNGACTISDVPPGTYTIDESTCPSGTPRTRRSRRTSRSASAKPKRSPRPIRRSSR